MARVTSAAARKRVRKVAVAKVVPPAPGLSYRRAEAYEEIPNGDGIMRVEAGDYVVTTTDATLVMPPSVFAVNYPDMVA